MLIETMPDVLTWTETEAVFPVVFNDYVNLLSDALGLLLREAEQHAPHLARDVLQELESATDAGFLRVLLAPETSYRLIHRREPLEERAGFVLGALRIEAVRAGQRLPQDCASEWTALGDCGLTADAAWRDLPQLANGLPFDTLSCHAAAVDLGGPSATAPRRPFTPVERDAVVAKLNAALSGIAKAGPVFRDFVRQFNIVLIAQIDRDDQNLFTSGSTGQYIGRSFITNPQKPSVRPIDLAEALVHEGIHSLLYMQERRVAWVHKQDLYDPLHARVTSPWTGSVLGVRPFLQACFVWYGLLHFWASALHNNAFNSRQVQGRMGIAVRGFLAGPLDRLLGDCRADIDPVVLTAIGTMQDRIVRSWPLEAA
jgi:HEXXH motif-containing protein